jgi:hypothetical protein
MEQHDMQPAPMNWENPAPATAISLEEFQALGVKLWEEKAKLEELEAIASKQSKEVEALKAKVISCLEAAGLDKFAVAGFGTVFKTQRFTVTVPKDGADREAFFGYLESQGIFRELITVNSQTLNSYWKKEFEAAVEQGNPDWKMPGIADPKHVITLGMRKG